MLWTTNWRGIHISHGRPSMPRIVTDLWKWRMHSRPNKPDLDSSLVSKYQWGSFSAMHTRQSSHHIPKSLHVKSSSVSEQAIMEPRIIHTYMHYIMNWKESRTRINQESLLLYCSTCPDQSESPREHCSVSQNLEQLNNKLIGTSSQLTCEPLKMCCTLDDEDIMQVNQECPCN